MRRMSGFSATLFASLSACGSDPVHHLPDGPTQHDGGVDVGPDATPSGDVTVTTLYKCNNSPCISAPGTPVAAVPVIVVQPDGSLGTGGMTGTDGKVTLHGVLSGAAISAVYPEDPNAYTYISTMLAVKPGDNLTFGEKYFGVTPTGTAGTMTINVPALTGATSYTAYTPCGSFGGGTAITVTQQTSCQSATAPIDLIATDDSGTPIGSSHIAAADFTNNAVVTAPTWTTNTANNLSMSVSGVIADVTNAAIGTFALGGSTSYGATSSATIATGAATYAGTVPSGWVRTYGLVELDRPNLNHQFYYKSGAAAASSIAVAESGLPWIAGTNYYNNVELNATIGKVLWLQTAGTSYDAAVLFASWYRTDVSNVTHYYSWNVILPPGVTELDFGHVPAALAPFVPASTDNINQTSVRLIDLSNAADYDALRQLPEWMLASPDAAVENGDVPEADFSGGEGFAKRAPQPMHHHR